MATVADKRGFALPAVLVVVGVVTLVFLVAITSLAGLADQTRQVLGEVRFEQAALDAEAGASFLAATQPLTSTALMTGSGASAPASGGFGDSSRQAADRIELDGRPYATPGPPRLLVSLQDEAGLVNLDVMGRNGAPGLFAALGVPPEQRAAMTDRLADYTDADDLKHAQGAEAADYVRAGVAPPPNALLRSATQLFGLLGWRQTVSPEAWAATRDQVTADPTSVSVNVNTASPTALKVLYGLTDPQVRAVVAQRAKAPLVNLEDFGRAAGVAMTGDIERVYTFPNGRFALKIVDPAAGLVARSRIVLTPQDAERPVWIEDRNVAILSKPERATTPANVPPLPRPAA